MGGTTGLILISALSGFLGTLLCIPRVKRLAAELGFLDLPGGRKHHREPIPLLGGVAIFLPLPLTFFVLQEFMAPGVAATWQPRAYEFISLFLATILIIALGLVDDRKQLGWRKKLVCQMLGVGILIAGGHGLPSASVPFIGPVTFGWFGYVIFALSVLTVTNAVNLIDGLDGLAGGICFFAASTWGIISLIKGDYSMAVLGLTLAGSLAAFLVFNFPPASIFMGDAGSLGLGFLLGTLATSATAWSTGQRPGTMSVALIPILPFGIALMDVGFSIVRRWISGRRVFLPDADHLHHRLMQEFKTPRIVLAIVYSFTAMLSIAAISVVAFPGLQSDLSLLAFLLVVIVFVVAAVLRLYRFRYFADALNNRLDVQFLEDFADFMVQRLRRATSTEEILSLLESGVQHLSFDSVEILNNDRPVRTWVNPKPVHLGRPRTEAERPLGPNGFKAKWSVPLHNSPDYQETLGLSWYRFMAAVDVRMNDLAEVDSEEWAKLDLRTVKN
jgi:UDP-GlcNAc:undecaprenyl-phosphate/decaprenyl-phosphate GlcNAc-1-phosphate transferase